MPLKAAVITNYNEDVAAIVTLLNGDWEVTYVYYDTGNSAKPFEQFDFIVIAYLESLTQLIGAYEEDGRYAFPPVLHLVEPIEVPQIKYGAIAHIVDITPIAQATLDVMDVTLNYEAYQGFIEERFG